jgi:hypothetical protein
MAAREMLRLIRQIRKSQTQDFDGHPLLSFSLTPGVHWKRNTELASSVGRFAATAMATYNTMIMVSWAVFLLIWAGSAFFVKQDVRGGGWQRY